MSEEATSAASAAAADAGTAQSVPVACTLSATDLSAQAGRWRELADRAMAGRTESPDGLRVCFRPEPGVEDELRELAAVESECCAWATWTVRAADGQVLLEVRSSGNGVAVLHELFRA